ncbi:MAG: hypothetical protein AAFN78_10555 [Pseudomonadota bacterium]
MTTRAIPATVITATCLVASCAWANPPLVEEAFANMGNKLDWSFTVATDTLESSRIEQHVASGGESDWTLVTLDGETPADEAQREYRERKAKETQKRRERGGNGFDTIAVDDSFELIEETDTHAVFSFQPAPDSDDDEKIMSMLRGLMKINKAGPYVESLQMNNSGKLKPAPMVRIHSLTIDIQFGPASDGGPWVPMSNTTVLEGKMAGFKKINQNTTIRYSDYSAPGQASE